MGTFLLLTALLDAQCAWSRSVFKVPYHIQAMQQVFSWLQVIRGLLSETVYVICVEHDLAVLDYLSDFICCLYGKPGAYGVVTLPFSVREGINIFLAGFVPTENLRFREEALTFRVSPPSWPRFPPLTSP